MRSAKPQNNRQVTITLTLTEDLYRVLEAYDRKLSAWKTDEEVQFHRDMGIPLTNANTLASVLLEEKLRELQAAD